MARAHTLETKRAAVADYERGVKSPVVCRRYGISERTLYRWLHHLARERAESDETVEPEAGRERTFFLAALRIVASELTDAQRENAVRKLRATLNMSLEGSDRLLETVMRDRERDGAAARRVGMASCYRRGDAPLAPAFGKAKWLVVASAPHRFRFFRNAGRTGVSMADRAAACTDVVALELGERTRERLASHGIRLWQGVAGLSLTDHLTLLDRGELRPVPSPLVTLAPATIGRR